jgi:hypothetical protein
MLAADGDFISVNDRNVNNNSNGQIRFRLRANGNDIGIETNQNFCDGQARLIVINKSGDAASDLEIYAGTTKADMQSPVGSFIFRNQSFDSGQYSVGAEMAFYAANDSGTISSHKAFTASFFEFATDTYNLKQREELIDIAPGLP